MLVFWTYKCYILSFKSFYLSQHSAVAMIGGDVLIYNVLVDWTQHIFKVLSVVSSIFCPTLPAPAG